MGFGARRPTNTLEGTPERDSTGGLFTEGYVFGVPVLPIENDPGEAFTPDRPQGDDQPSWVTAPPNQEPLPADFVKPGGASGAWKNWDGKGSLSVFCPNNADVRSIYIPVMPAANITFASGSAATVGAGFYVSNAPSYETVPIPEGSKVITLVADQVFLAPISVYCTSDILPPGRG